MGRLLASIPLLVVLAVGCDQISIRESGPEGDLSAYLEARRAGDWDAAYGYVSSSDRAARTLAKFKEEAQRRHAPLVAGQTTFTLAGIESSGDTAIVEVDVSIPDFSGLLASAFSSAFSGASETDIQEDLARKAEDGGVPMRTERQAFTLLREPAGWRVFLDWETRGRVAKLIDDAESLEKEKKLRAALAKYDEVLTLDGAMVEPRKARDEIASEIEVHEQKQAYISSLALFDLQAKYYKTYSGRVPGVEFKLRNDGERTLERVEVTVYFKSRDGTVIAEEDYNPVLVSEYSFGRNNKPLKPKYVWQMERGKFYKADAVPDEWKEGAVSAQITDIVFAES